MNESIKPCKNLNDFCNYLAELHLFNVRRLVNPYLLYVSFPSCIDKIYMDKFLPFIPLDVYYTISTCESSENIIFTFYHYEK